MITRIKAVKSTFGLALTTFELVIAFHLLVSFLGKGGYDTAVNFGSIFSGQNNSTSFIEKNNLTGPFNFLLIVLAFMVFTLLLVSFLPKMVGKRERQMEMDFE